MGAYIQGVYRKILQAMFSLKVELDIANNFSRWSFKIRC